MVYNRDSVIVTVAIDSTNYYLILLCANTSHTFEELTVLSYDLVSISMLINISIVTNELVSVAMNQTVLCLVSLQAAIIRLVLQ